MIASPITGLVRGLNALIAGLAIQLQQIAEQGLVGGGEPPAEEAPAEAPAEDSAAEEAAPQTETTDAPSQGDEDEETNGAHPAEPDASAQQKEG
jgi:large subunit ribosomal protein L10